MTSAVSAPESEIYDPDEEPEDEGIVGRLTVSAYVDEGHVSPSQGEAKDADIVKQCQSYADKAKYNGPIWFLEAEGISLQRADGAPFLMRDVVKMKTSGDTPRVSPTPNLVAKLFTELGASASYAKVGTEDSAVGRVFTFVRKAIKFGGKGGFEKPLRLYPQTLFDKDYVYDGEVRKFTPKPQEGEEGAATDGGASNAPDEATVVDILKELFAGQAPSQMMDLVMGDARLQSVATIFGVPLLESATDESLVATLTENKVMAVNGDGVLEVI